MLLPRAVLAWSFLHEPQRSSTLSCTMAPLHNVSPGGGTEVSSEGTNAAGVPGTSNGGIRERRRVGASLSARLQNLSRLCRKRAKSSHSGHSKPLSCGPVLQAVGVLLILVLAHRYMVSYMKCVRTLSQSFASALPKASPQGGKQSGCSRRLAVANTGVGDIVLECTYMVRKEVADELGEINPHPLTEGQSDPRQKSSTEGKMWLALRVIAALALLCAWLTVVIWITREDLCPSPAKHNGVANTTPPRTTTTGGTTVAPEETNRTASAASAASGNASTPAPVHMAAASPTVSYNSAPNITSGSSSSVMSSLSNASGNGHNMSSTTTSSVPRNVSTGGLSGNTTLDTNSSKSSSPPGDVTSSTTTSTLQLSSTPSNTNASTDTNTASSATATTVSTVDVASSTNTSSLLLSSTASYPGTITASSTTATTVPTGASTTAPCDKSVMNFSKLFFMTVVTIWAMFSTGLLLSPFLKSLFGKRPRPEGDSTGEITAEEEKAFLRAAEERRRTRRENQRPPPPEVVEMEISSVRL